MDQHTITTRPLTKRQRAVLSCIRRHEGQPYREIARRMGIGLGTVARHITALDAKGWITRNPLKATGKVEGQR